MQNIIKFIHANLNSNYVYNENDIEKLDKDNHIQIKNMFDLKYDIFPLTTLVYDINNRLFIYEWIDTEDEVEYSLYIELDKELFNTYINKEIQEHIIFDNPIDGIYYIELASLHGRVDEVYELYKVKNLTITNYSKNLTDLYNETDIVDYNKINEFHKDIKL